MSQYLLVNLGISVLFGLGYFLDIIHFPYLRNITGVIYVYFLTGYNLSYLIFSGKDLKNLERFLMSVILSMVSLPLLIFLTHNFLNLKINFQNVILQILGLVFISVILNLFLFWYRKEWPTYQFSPKRFWRDDNLLCLALFMYFFIFGIVILLYKFIPGVDSYNFLLSTERIIQEGDYFLAGFFYPIVNYRPFFTNLTVATSLISRLDPYFIFKYFLVLLPALTALPFYLYALKLTRNRFLIFLTTIAPLTVPIIVIESWMARPQTILFILLPIALYFLALSIEQKSYKLSIVILVISLLLLKFHELSVILIIVSLFNLIFLAKDYIKQNPIESFFLFILLIIGLYPWVRDLGYFVMVKQALINLSKAGFHFRAWFLSDYINVDGVRLQLKGLQVFNYYLYNIGLLGLLLIFMYAFIQSRVKKIRFGLSFSSSPFLVSGFLFFAIAEIMPRFGLTVLPDRAWPFLMLSLIFLFPYFEKVFQKLHFFEKKLFWVLASWACFGSFLISFYIVWSHQGYVSKKEYEAALWIKNNSPPGSVFVSQEANSPMIQYFGRRRLAVPSENIFSSRISINEAIQSAQLASEMSSPLNILTVRKEIILKEIEQAIAKMKNPLSTKLYQESLRDYQLNINDLSENINDLSVTDERIIRFKKLEANQSATVYLLYSYDKFRYRYKNWDVWREKNFYQADLSKFDQKEFFEKVFDNEAVKIWRVKNEVNI